MGPPRVMQDNAKVRIRAVTSDLERWEHIDAAHVHMVELGAMLGKGPGKEKPRERTTQWVNASTTPPQRTRKQKYMGKV